MRNFLLRCPDDPVGILFSRRQVVSLDFAPFLSAWAADKLPGNPLVLRRMMGSLVVAVDGYDEDPRALHCIPEVRRFLRGFHAQWPYYLYFACTQPSVSTLPHVAWSCINDCTVVEYEKTGLHRTDYTNADLLGFLLQAQPFFRELCQRANVSDGQLRRRLEDVFRLFNLPASLLSMRQFQA